MKPKRSKWPLLRLILLCAASAMLFVGAFGVLRVRYAKRNEARLAAVAEAVLAAYPDVSETELLRLLRDPPKADDSLFRRYGISAGELVAAPERQTMNAILIAGLGAVALLAGGTILLGISESKRRRRETQALISYLDAVAGGNYGLKIDENVESDFSLLTNRLYDLTVRLREAAAESHANSRAQSRWLQDISHQIRTPLTSAVIMLDALSDANEMDEATRREFAAESARQLDVIERLIDALLKLSKLDSGTVTLKTELLTARRLLANAEDRLGVLLDLKSVAVEASGDLDVSFPADEAWQTEALTNILKNCAEHSSPGSAIRVAAENTGAYLRLTVTDEGEGIDEADLPHIFERFYKAKNAGPESVGIGLSLAKSVIEAQNGYLSVRSEKGVGTRFAIGYKR